MSAAHQSEVSRAFVHERRQAAGHVSELGLPAGRLHYDYSSWQCQIPGLLFFLLF